MEIQHCTHPHPLIPCDKKNGVPCSGCEQPLLGLVYGCAACDFFLHKSCTELPPEIEHPFHPQHPLSLLPRLPLDAMPVRFWCDACWKTCSSFTFRCHECSFNLDLGCALLTPTVKCELHEHPLAFFKNLSLDNKCHVCDALCNASVLRCVYCSVGFHVQCLATLPQTVKLECHRHSLIFTDSLVEDDSEELYCDACEEQRIPNQSVYCCPECNIIAHVYCSINEILPTLFKASEEGQSVAAVDPVLARLDREIRILRCESAVLAGKLIEVTRKLKELDEKKMDLVATALSRRITLS